MGEMSLYVLFQEGNFELHLKHIRAVRRADLREPTPAVPSHTLTATQLLTLIKSTIARGAYLYDKSYTELCGAVYESSMRTIVAATPPVEPTTLAIAKAALAKAAPYPVNTDSRASWIYCRAFDAILLAHGCQSDTVLPESSFPSVARGDWVVVSATTTKDQPHTAATITEGQPDSTTILNTDAAETNAAHHALSMGKFWHTVSAAFGVIVLYST